MRHAFVVGVSEYDDKRLETLSFAVRDAEELHAILVDERYGAVDGGAVLLRNPTSVVFINALGKFLKSLQAGDEFILQFSGHGSRLPRGGLALCFRDTQSNNLTFSAVSDSKLSRLLRQNGAARGILILDTCFSRAGAGVNEKFRHRSGGEAGTPIQAHEGLTIIWACGSHEHAYESAGHGVFTGRLVQALRSGADVPPAQGWITPGDALRWIRQDLKGSPVAEHCFPGLRTSGDVSQLYLAKNPNYDGVGTVLGGGGDQEVTDLSSAILELQEELGLAAICGDPEEDAKRLKGLGRRLVAGETPDANFVVLRPGHAPAIWNRIAAVALAGWSAYVVSMILHGLVRPLGVDVSDPTAFRTSVWLGVATGVATFVWCVRSYLRIFSNLRTRFLVVTEGGFLEAKGGPPNEPNFVVVPWAMVQAQEHTTKNGSEKLMVKLIRGSGCIVYDASEIDYRGGLNAIASAFQEMLDRRALRPALGVAEGRERDRALAAGDRLTRRFVLVGVSQYDHFPTLVAPVADVRSIRDLIGDAWDEMADRRLLDPDLTTFEFELAAAFEAAADKVLVLCFSGHGLLWDGELYLAVTNTEPARVAETGFHVEKLLDAAIENHLDHLVVILDCCFSGAGGASVGLSADALHNIERLFEAERDSVTIMAASGADAPAYEVAAGGNFTLAFVGAAKELLQKDGVATVEKLNATIRSRLDAAEDGQVHRLYASATGLGTELFARETAAKVIKEEFRESVAQKQEELVDQQNVLLEQLADSVERGEPSAPAGRHTHSETGEEFDLFRCTFVYGRSAGHLMGLSVPAFILVFVFLWDGSFDLAMFVLAGLALLWGLWYVWARRATSRGPRFLVVAESGIVHALAGQLRRIPGCEVLRLTSAYEQDQNTSVTTLKLTLVSGEEIELARDDQQWSPEFEKITESLEVRIPAYRLAVNAVNLAAIADRTKQRTDE